VIWTGNEYLAGHLEYLIFFAARGYKSIVEMKNSTIKKWKFPTNTGLRNKYLRTTML